MLMLFADFLPLYVYFVRLLKICHMLMLIFRYAASLIFAITMPFLYCLIIFR